MHVSRMPVRKAPVKEGKGGGNGVRYSLYVDRIFWMHFVMEALLLWLTAHLAQVRFGWRRLLCGAAAGAGTFLFLLLCRAAIFRPLPCKFLLLAAGVLAMLQLAFGFQEKKALLETAAWYLAAACLLGGVLAACEGIRMGIQGMAWKESALHLLLPAAVAAAGGCALLEGTRRRKRVPFCRVRIKAGDAAIEVTALWDSGNSLRDPFLGRPVCVAEKPVLEAIGMFERPEKIRAIPYHAVGRSSGVLYAAEADAIYIRRGGQELKCCHVLIAASEQKLSAQGKCQMLLHPALLEEKRGENHDFESSDARKNAV